MHALCILRFFFNKSCLLSIKKKKKVMAKLGPLVCVTELDIVVARKSSIIVADV